MSMCVYCIYIYIKSILILNNNIRYTYVKKVYLLGKFFGRIDKMSSPLENLENNENLFL